MIDRCDPKSTGSYRIAIIRRLSRAGEPRRHDSRPKPVGPASNSNKPEAAEARRRREQDHSTAAEPPLHQAAVLRADRLQRRQPRLLRHQLGPEHWTSPCKQQAPLKLRLVSDSPTSHPPKNTPVETHHTTTRDFDSNMVSCQLRAGRPSLWRDWSVRRWILARLRTDPFQ